MKTIGEVTQYDVMGEDLDVWITNNKQFGFDLEIDDENGKELVKEKGIHPCAAESLADFCRAYLIGYENAILKRAS